MSDDDSVLYDSPTDFVHGAVHGGNECIAQSVVPLDDGTYICACSCARWEVTAPSRETGLQLAREHTAVLAAVIDA